MTFIKKFSSMTTTIILWFLLLLVVVILLINNTQIDILSTSFSLLHRTPYNYDSYNNNSKMVELQRLLKSNDSIDTFNNSNSNSTTSFSKWSTLSNHDLSLLSYDTSSFNVNDHYAFGAAYLSNRGRGVQSLLLEGGGGSAAQEEEGSVDSHQVVDTRESSYWSLTSFLRGKKSNLLSPPSSLGRNSNTASNYEEEENNKQQQEQQQADDRNLQWMTHTGNDNNIPQPPSSSTATTTTIEEIDPNDGISIYEIEQHTSNINSYSYSNLDTNIIIDEDEEQEEELLQQRLNEAVATVNELNLKYVRYDTNDLYNYSNPNVNAVNVEQEGQLNDNDSNSEAQQQPSTTLQGEDDMVQFSHTVATTRQRLLTGSYAAWQWYDRSSLASPTNLNLQKVSRINYAFFQSNEEGYIFGTDSWADPNVLFGPYDFATSSDKLPQQCKGGKGRDDGINKDSVWSGQKNGDEQSVTVAGSASSGFGSGFRRERRYNNRRQRQRQRRRAQEEEEEECKYFEQCHRNFPNSKSCNIHKYKEGLIYRAHTSGAQIYPSIGGWTLSGSFPQVAADVNKRKRFARECVGLIRDYGFDGIDIDWEYPGYEPHGGSPRDRENFNKLLLEVREALNNYQINTGDEPLGGGAFGLTAALPCGPANIDFLDVPFLSRVLDGMSLMTFDFHNEMESVTGVNSPLYDQDWDTEPGLSVDGCVNNYYEAGAGEYAKKISIGVPFYGKTYSYATELNGFHSQTEGRFGGFVDQANWPQDLGTPVYYNIINKMSKGTMISKRHEPTKTQYAYFKDGSGLVTFDDQQAVCDKADYVNMNLLGGLFVWEMSGDLMENLDTPLLDAINRKLEEINFDCRILASSEDGVVVELPAPAPKGPAQIERLDDENVVTAVLDHLDRAEEGRLISGGGGEGAFTRGVFVYRTWDKRTFPSYVYRYPHFVDALRTMATKGVDGNLFYLGEGQEVIEDEEAVPEEAIANDATRQRLLQKDSGAAFDETPLGATEVYETSLVYGLVNIAAYLAQAMTDSIIHDACDELNVEYLPNDDADGVGLDDGKDIFRFPISNSCGQNGRSYQNEQCEASGDIKYDCTTEMNVEELANMEASGTSRGHWRGAPGSFYCGSKEMYGTTGFWDSMVGRELDVTPTANAADRTDVEGCCWWGRGSLSIKGTCLYGKLNYHLGKAKADREGAENAMFPDVDFCHDPGQICAGQHSVPLRWISGMYHWMENVQKYDRDGFKYMDELTRYVNEDLLGTDFFNKVTKIHLRGCHQEGCSDISITDMDNRLRAFEKVLALLGLQFGSHAEAEPPFVAFPGQQQPTPPPTVIPEELEVTTDRPTPAPIEMTETLIVPVNVFLTGVLDGVNMTNDEQKIFEGLLYDMLVPRLGTVDVEVVDVVTDHQIPNPEDLNGELLSFESETQSLVFGDRKPVLQAVMNVTVSYSPPEPEGLRDWSIYVKSWIESFGTTMVEIFTSPKHIQHPQTTSKFWDDLTDVSSTNIDPPNTEPTSSPTPEPEPVIIYPDNSANTYIIAGVSAGVGLAICAFCVCFCMKLKQFRKLQAEERERKLRWLDDEESYVPEGKSFADPFALPTSSEPLEKVTEDDNYSSGSDSHTDDSASSNGEEQEESVYTNDQSAAQSQSYYSEDMEASNYEEESAYEEEQSYVSQGASMYSKSTYGEETSSALRSRGFASRESGRLSEEEGSYYTHSLESTAPVPEEEQMKQFDDIVQRVLADDPTLKNINLDGRTQIAGHDYTSEELWTALVSNNHVTHLSLRECNMVNEDAASLSLALGDNTSITHIWLGDNEITSEGVEYLIATLESNQTIVLLDLLGNQDIDPALEEEVRAILDPRENTYIAELMERVRDNDPTLTELNLGSMGIGLREDVLSMFDVLRGNSHIQVIDLSRNEIDDDCVSSISVALLDNTSVTYLNLVDNVISSEGAEHLIGILDSNKTLKDINLNGNMVEPEILDEINAMMIERRPSLVECVVSNDPNVTELNLNGINLVESSQTDQLIEGLAKNTNVTLLSLDNTEMDDTLVATLSLALVDNTGITHLSLRDNLITSEGCEYLLGTLDTNVTISHLDLDGNQIDNHLMEEIDAILSQRQTQAGSLSMAEEVPLSDILDRVKSNDPTLKEVLLDNRQLAASNQAELLFDYIAGNTVVKKLSLCNNDIEDTLAAALSLALVDNATINQVLLSDNKITSEGCEYLLGTLDTNTTVCYIELSGNLIEDRLMDEIDAINEERYENISYASSAARSASRSGASSAASRSRAQSTVSGSASRSGTSSVASRSRAQSTVSGSVSRSGASSAASRSRAQSNVSGSVSRSGASSAASRSRAQSTVSGSVSRSGASSAASRSRAQSTVSGSVSRSGASSAASRSRAQSTSVASRSNTTSRSGKSNQVDMTKPPMHEVPEETDAEIQKRKAILEIMKDNSIPWNEKNQRIIEVQKKFYVAPYRKDDDPQAAAEDDAGSCENLINRILENDKKIVKVDLDGQELGRERETALFEALAQNNCVTSLSLVNCRIGNDGAAELKDALQNNSTLTYVNLEDNQITSNAAQSLITVLKDHNKTLQHLELKDNKVRSGLLTTISKLLEKRREALIEVESTTSGSKASSAGKSKSTSRSRGKARR